jgi:hypothetical protein
MDYRWANEEGQTGKGLTEPALVIPRDARLTALFKVFSVALKQQRPRQGGTFASDQSSYCPAGALGAAAPGCAGGGGTPDFTL